MTIFFKQLKEFKIVIMELLNHTEKQMTATSSNSAPKTTILSSSLHQQWTLMYHQVVIQGKTVSYKDFFSTLHECSGG